VKFTVKQIKALKEFIGELRTAYMKTRKKIPSYVALAKAELAKTKKETAVSEKYQKSPVLISAGLRFVSDSKKQPRWKTLAAATFDGNGLVKSPSNFKENTNIKGAQHQGKNLIHNYVSSLARFFEIVMRTPENQEIVVKGKKITFAPAPKVQEKQEEEKKENDNDNNDEPKQPNNINVNNEKQNAQLQQPQPQPANQNQNNNDNDEEENKERKENNNNNLPKVKKQLGFTDVFAGVSTLTAWEGTSARKLKVDLGEWQKQFKSKYDELKADWEKKSNRYGRGKHKVEFPCLKEFKASVYLAVVRSDIETAQTRHKDHQDVPQNIKDIIGILYYSTHPLLWRPTFEGETFKESLQNQKGIPKSSGLHDEVLGTGESQAIQPALGLVKIIEMAKVSGNGNKLEENPETAYPYQSSTLQL